MRSPRRTDREKPGVHEAPADQRLLRITADHLKRLGPQQVTVVSIADAAGMTHANVYRYFPSKVALIDAVVEQWLRSLEAQIAGIADSPDPADDKLERLIEAWAQSHRRLLGSDPHLFDVYCSAVEAARPLVRRHRARMRQLQERVLDEGIATAKFDPRDRERALAFISDATYRFVNPIAMRLDAQVPPDMIASRMAAMIRVVLRSLAVGAV